MAAVYYGPEDVRVEEREVPEIRAGEALLQVVSTGICGTDLRIYHGAHRKYLPGTVRVPGHEVVGDIVAVGEAVKGLEIGQRVFVAPNMGCGHCPQCVSGNNNLCANYDAIGITIDGSFAEYLRIPAAAIAQGNIIPIDPGVDPAVASLIEPFACVVRGQDALHIQPGEVVLVMGAGPIGTMHALLAELRGAGKVIVSEPNPLRAAQAAETGCGRVVNPVEEDLAAEVNEETGGRGADVIIVAAPAHQAQQSALELAALRGRINFFGGLPKDRPTIQFDSNMVHYKELTVTGTTGCSTDDCLRAAAIVNSGRIDLSPLVSARYPLSQALEAIKTTEGGRALKVVLEP
jgi:L-iditol 2-dehydrogenase